MPDIPASVIVTAVTTLVSGALGAFITNVLNSRRSTDEKIWELRRTSYGSILAELAAVESVLDDIDSDIVLGRHFTQEITNTYNKETGTHLESARKAYTDNYLILSERFIELFEDFLRSLNYEVQYPPEEYKVFSGVIRAARPKLLQQARSEMPLCRGRHKPDCRRNPRLDLDE